MQEIADMARFGWIYPQPAGMIAAIFNGAGLGGLALMTKATGVERDGTCSGQR